tara:strand:- start:47 stop:679 length:633 start_codon:yes stop_codon:yes gene_type:complete
MSAVNNYGRKDNRWIGIILPFESQKEQMSGNSRGNRYRVAIMGVTPFVGGIRDEDVTFADVMCIGGLGGGGHFRTVKYSPGEVVVGFYWDFPENQQPMIMGGVGRTAGIRYGSGRFDAKTGFVGSITPGNLMGRHESNEQQNNCLPLAEPSDDKSKSRAQPFGAMGDLGVNLATPVTNSFTLPPDNTSGNTSATFGNLAQPAAPNLGDAL